MFRSILFDTGVKIYNPIQNMRKGFTLVELAIVLVIVGLLIAGVLQGRELIRAANIQKVMREVENLKRGFLTFQSKYDCIPGDCGNAIMFLGPVTFNGNNDQQITGLTDGTNTTYEQLFSIQHLGMAELLEPPLNNDPCYLNPNLSNLTTLFDDCSLPIAPFNSTVFPATLADSTNVLACINTGINCSTPNANSGFNAENADQFDRIFDDGNLGTGKVTGTCAGEACSAQVRF
jgi:prepilin-type N-terminal cleavage/methylation domain-containing protein